jgi:hypothetical protein
MPEAEGVMKDDLEQALHRLRGRKVIEPFESSRSWRIRRIGE